MEKGQKPSRGWVLYDGECRFCVRWLRFWEPVLRQNGFGVEALQANWVAPALGMPVAELLHDIRVYTRDGETVSGANAYLYVMRRVWWMWPLWAVFTLPGFNALMHAGYRWFARNRYCVSGACRIHPHEGARHQP
jgi:predicted DCC family thiol-disulfide oxidoreductase YuxK